MSPGMTSQDLKIRRMLGHWVVSLLIFVMAALLLWFEIWRGAGDPAQGTWLTVFAFSGVGVSFLLIWFSTRIGIRFRKITMLQGVHAIISIIGAYVCIPAVRGGTLLLLLVVLALSSFTLRLKDSRRMSIFAIALLGCTMGWLVHSDPVGHAPADEAVYFLLASSMLAAVTFLTGQFDYLRTRLEAEKGQLNEALSKISRLASSDELTRVPNRRHMNEVLSEFDQPGRDRAAGICFILVDIDHFKAINDRYGHRVGDEVLQAFAVHLQFFLRVTDIIARWGGEEFLVLLKGVDEATASALVEQMQKQPLAVMTEGVSEPIRVTFSAGLALVAKSEKLVDTINRADKAMFQAKSEGRNTYRLYDPVVDTIRETGQRHLLELAQAVGADQLVLHFQPQVGPNGAVTGAEALVRWNHPSRGIVGPHDFIAAAEESGLIHALGDWVLVNACRQLHEWSKDVRTSHLDLAVNVSAKQLHAPDFAARVMAAVDATGIDPRRLKLELTESTLLADVDETILKMQTLDEHGIRFSLDDFGTGYSSLSYVKRLPLYQLKIDRSFVRDMLLDPRGAAIVSAIIGLARSLSLQVIAEGVETVSQRDRLLVLGCKHYQGYLFSKPLPIGLFDDFIATQTVIL